MAKALEQVQALDSQVHIINGVVGGEDGGAERRKGHADQVGAGEDERCLALGCDADDAAAAVEAGGKVNVALARDGEALRAAKTAIPDARVAVGIDGPDGVVG